MIKKNKKIEMIRVEHIWSVLCGNSSVDQMSQNISLFSIFEQLNLKKEQVEIQKKANEKILVPINFQLVTFLRKVGNGQFSGSLKAEIISPEGDVLGFGENEAKFITGKDRLRVIFRFPGMPIVSAGYYEFRVSLRTVGDQYEKIAGIPLQVLLD